MLGDETGLGHGQRARRQAVERGREDRRVGRRNRAASRSARWSTTDTVARELSIAVALIAEITGGVTSSRLWANTTSTQ